MAVGSFRSRLEGRFGAPRRVLTTDTRPRRLRAKRALGTSGLQRYKERDKTAAASAWWPEPVAGQLSTSSSSFDG